MRRIEEEVKIEEIKIRMENKSFVFSRDEIVKFDRKVSVKLPKLKMITKFEHETIIQTGITCKKILL